MSDKVRLFFPKKQVILIRKVAIWVSASTTAAVQVISLPPPSSSAACHGTKAAFKVQILQTAHEDMFGPLTTSIPGSEAVERHQAKVQRDGSFDSSESVIQKSHLRDWNPNTQDIRVQEISYQPLLLEYWTPLNTTTFDCSMVLEELDIVERDGWMGCQPPSPP